MVIACGFDDVSTLMQKQFSVRTCVVWLSHTVCVLSASDDMFHVDGNESVWCMPMAVCGVCNDVSSRLSETIEHAMKLQNHQNGCDIVSVAIHSVSMPALSTFFQHSIPLLR